jgi:hypothetical protein
LISERLTTNFFFFSFESKIYFSHLRLVRGIPSDRGSAIQNIQSENPRVPVLCCVWNAGNQQLTHCAVVALFSA